MAIKSMTGFGAGVVSTKKMRISVELSSVNRKQLEVVLRLPSQMQSIEPCLQKIAQEKISRGRVSGSVQIDIIDDEESVLLDKKRAAIAIKELRNSAKQLKLEDDLSASDLLKIPGLITVNSAKYSVEDYSSQIELAFCRALKKLVAMRTQEGRALASDLKERLKLLSDMLGKISKRAPVVASIYKKRLLLKLEKENFKSASTDERVLKEIALFGDKSDISEEITRLTSHIKQFSLRLRSFEPVGRELDFLVQELLREINTISSKANDLKITEICVAFKTEIERIREQAQNVE